jgi:predicted Zn finger-like uncharacterized protein
MALATQCPHCQTTFRVAHDQLKLRAGLVRCGSCKQIFNGIENLLRSEEQEQANAPAPIPQASGAVESTPPQPFDSGAAQTSFDPPTNNSTDDTPSIAQRSEPLDGESTAPEAFDSSESTVRPASDDPLLRMTLMDFTYAPAKQGAGKSTATQADAPLETDRLEQTIDDLQSKPWRDAHAEDGDADELDRAEEFEEPSFVLQGRRRQRLGRALHAIMAIGSGALLVGLLAQGGYVFRDQIAAWFPQSKPVLSEICARLDCQLGLPAQIESVSIESNELQTIAADNNTFTLSVLLRNHGAVAQAWPHIELTLNDTNEQAIARKVFQPRDYLASMQEAGKGFGPKSEQPVKIHFALSQLKASGYRVYLFYP